MKKPDLFAMTYPLNVLVSDNDTYHREETVKLLTGMGYHPHEAVSDEALNSLVEKGRYDVILLNVRITGSGATDKPSIIVQQPRPLMIGISQSARLDFSVSLGCVASDILLFRPTTKEELIVRLKSCSILAGKFMADCPPKSDDVGYS